ncbi:MAG: hypothetical protein ACREBW_07615, partial [Candidatus Micrarchaeaceae archaeon]
LVVALLGLWRQRWLFLGIGGMYIALYLVFVHGLGNTTDTQSVRQQLSAGIAGNSGQLFRGVGSFATLLAGSNGSATDAGSVYQVLLGLITSLAVIWSVRQVSGNGKATIRGAFYKGSAPLVPFILVLALLLVELVPLLVGGGLYNMAVTYGIAVNPVEQWLWGLLFFVLAIISLYMLCYSVFAIYIVTLPDMKPIEAVRKSWRLVQYRLLPVIRKLLFLLIIFTVVGCLVVLPAVLFVPVIAQWILLAMSVVGLIVLHAYLYTLYKELIV